MTLTDALRTASHSLNTSSKVLSTVSHNITGVNNPDYVRRDARIYSDTLFSTRVQIAREVDASIFTASITANANLSRSNAILSGLDQLTRLQGGDGFTGTAASSLQQLRQSLELAAANPSNEMLLSQAVLGAQSFASTINSSYEGILRLRQEADAAIADGVSQLNELLARFEETNTTIVKASMSGQDAFDSEDIRDTLIGEISELMGVSVIRRENNDMMLVASNGAVLFDRRAREVSFEPIPIYGPNTTGNAVLVDGVPISGNNSLPIHSGSLVGQLELRDDILLQQQNQMDEIARAAVELFAETDQTGGGKLPLAGLFTWSGGPAVPASGVLEPGIALSLEVNPLIDPSAGGDVRLLRDGGINGDPDYISNTGSAAGFADRLFELSMALDTQIVFDAQAGLGSNISLSAFASGSLDNLQQSRQEVSDRAAYQQDLASHIKQTLQEDSGPNLDYEMSALLQVERAYQASAKVMSAVDELLAQLLQAV